MTSARKILVSSLILAFALGSWAFIFEPGFGHHVEIHSLKIPAWPVSLKKLKIAVLTDLHVGSPYNGLSKLRKIIALTNNEKPDLILLAGDFVIQGVAGGTFVAPEDIAPELRNLSAPLGVFAVLGNHDYWLDGARVTRALENSGIRVLTNKSVKMNFADTQFWLSGFDDSWTGKPDIEGTLQQVTDDSPVIAFTHNPDLFVDIPARVSLTIAGHTHGGQVYIPFIGRPIVPSEYGQRFAVGLIVEDGRNLFVAQGTGTSILPVRFLVPPEITILQFD